MAIFFPDLSHYDLDRGVNLEPGTVAVIVKGTHGALFLDSGYEPLRAQAFRVGAYTIAYHWLNHGNADKQALFCWQQLGRIPVMIDAEDQPGNSGYTGPLTVDDIATFAQTLRELGGTCNLVYLPQWYWSTRMGSPDLRPLAAIGLGLVSSNYTTYSDTGPGWASYGGMTPVQWQYTDNLPYGGSTCDFNAFRGTVGDYEQLTQGGVPEMEQGDLVQAWNGQSRPVAIGWILGDQANLRDYWYAKPDGTTIAPPPAGSRADLLIKAAQAILTGAGTQLTFTDAQIAALTPALVAAVTSAHDALTDADKPVIEAAVAKALTGLTLRVQ